MSRLAAFLVLALALLQGSGLHASLSELACAREHHETDVPGGECPPECATCACCARVTFTPVERAALLLEPSRELTSYADGGPGHVPEPPPRGILHVPRTTA